MRRKRVSIYNSVMQPGINAKLAPMTDAQKLPSPSLLRRLSAILYDSLLVIGLVAVVNALALGVLVQVTAGTEQVLDAHLVQILTALCVLGFFCFFWLKTGQTLGMQAWRIKLVDFGGGRPSLGKAVLRCLGACFSAICLGLGYLWCLIDRNNRYWHDYLSGTELVLLPKRNKKETSV